MSKPQQMQLRRMNMTVRPAEPREFCSVSRTGVNVQRRALIPQLKASQEEPQAVQNP